MLIAGALLFAGCGSNQPPVAPVAYAAPKPVITAPFRYHKLVEVSPGQDYDIFSWGRGATTVGAFMILHSDSAAKKYTTTTGDLDGTITDVYNTDMDMDGNPEILIAAKTTDTINYFNIYAFEFTYGKAQKLDFPKLTKTQKLGYRGNDNFYIKDGQLFREYPLYTGSGKAAKPSGQKRLLQYGLRDNSFTVKQLSKDSTKTSPPNPGTKGAVTSTESASKTTPKKKHTEEKKHKKKKRRHHVSEEE